MFDTIKHDGLEHAGYIAFLLMLGIFPFIFSLVYIICLIWGTNFKPFISIINNIMLESQLSSFIYALKPGIAEIIQLPTRSFLTLSILSSIWTSSSIFEGLRTILNRAYRVEKPPSYLFRRLLSIIEFSVVILVIGLLLIIISAEPVMVQYLDKYIARYVPGTDLLLLFIKSENLHSLSIFCAMFFIIAYANYFLPNRKNKFKYIIPGTILNLIGWNLCSISFKYYINTFPQINLIYGSIAGFIIALIYFYLCAIIFIYCAEFNHQYIHYMSKPK